MLRGSKGIFTTLQTNSLGEIDLTIGNEVTKYLVDIRDILSILSPTNFSIPLPWSTETIQTMGVSNQPMTVSKSLPICFQLGPIKGTHQFLSFGLLCYHSSLRTKLSWSSQSLYFFLSKGGNILTFWASNKWHSKGLIHGLIYSYSSFFSQFNWTKPSFRFYHKLTLVKKMSPTPVSFIPHQRWKWTKVNLYVTSINTL